MYRDYYYFFLVNDAIEYVVRYACVDASTGVGKTVDLPACMDK